MMYLVCNRGRLLQSPTGPSRQIQANSMARHSSRKGPSKKSVKSSLSNQPSTKSKSKGPSTTTAAPTSDAPLAPPINYEVIENLPRPAKLAQIERQLKITKTSTASLGKYDNKLKGEPAREKGKRRQFESNEIKDSNTEREKYLIILGRLDEDEIKKRRKEGAKLEKTGELVNVRKAIRGASKGRGSANLAGEEKRNKGKKGAGGKTRSSMNSKTGKGK